MNVLNIQLDSDLAFKYWTTNENLKEIERHSYYTGSTPSAQQMMNEELEKNWEEISLSFFDKQILRDRVYHMFYLLETENRTYHLAMTDQNTPVIIQRDNASELHLYVPKLEEDEPEDEIKFTPEEVLEFLSMY